MFLMTDKAGERSAEDTYAPSQIWNSSLGQQLSQYSGSLSHKMEQGGGRGEEIVYKGAEPKAAQSLSVILGNTRFLLKSHANVALSSMLHLYLL